MDFPSKKKCYLDIEELVQISGLSRSTIWRLKSAGKIPFLQPAGKGGRVKFPRNAIEQMAAVSAPSPAATEAENGLPGPKPAWMTK